ncbi:tape-measure protein [Streptomyces sp. NPDC005820]|uniref:tape-measure protein n=1 Tax=Streptomyces sp. NPDC005820 TaxID=3157069 RepID=UPI0033C70A2A
MSTPAAANPLAGAAPALTAFRSRVEQGSTTLRSLTDRIKAAAGGADRMGTAAARGSTAVSRARAGTDAAARAVTRTGRTAVTAASGIKEAASGGRAAGRTLGRLGSALGGVFAIVGALIGASGVLGDLMGTFGTLMTIGSGVLLVINALTRANPIGFVTGLLLPVAGWLLDLALNSETGQRLMEQLATLVLKYVEGYLAVLAPVLKAVGGAVNTYVTGYLGLVTTVLTGLATLIGTAFTVVNALASGDTRAIGGRVSALWRGVKDAVRPVLDWIGKDVPGMFTRVKDATSRTLDALGRFVTTGAQTVAGVVKGPVQGLIAFANRIIDGLNSLSFSILGKKFGVHLTKIPMLGEGGVAVPGAVRAGGRVLPLTALDRQRSLSRRHPAPPSSAPAPARHHVEEFHESAGAGAHGTAEDLLFLAGAHTCA